MKWTGWAPSPTAYFWSSKHFTWIYESKYISSSSPTSSLSPPAIVASPSLNKASMPPAAVGPLIIVSFPSDIWYHESDDHKWKHAHAFHPNPTCRRRMRPSCSCNRFRWMRLSLSQSLLVCGWARSTDFNPELLRAVVGVLPARKFRWGAWW